MIPLQVTTAPSPDEVKAAEDRIAATKRRNDERDRKMAKSAVASIAEHCGGDALLRKLMVEYSMGVQEFVDSERSWKESFGKSHTHRFRGLAAPTAVRELFRRRRTALSSKSPST
ncbi:hypothetical protein [Rhizobium laguerreae]|uniref:hypothetical protein n=1 Tax=Rhizobium laguerreae TaxID=1076926 RepID=UPI001C91D6EF|nr:hypothetical protein [Rhizobium laguerreae]MBY3127375.1 hypothetical protein [Rhizobium laguerreae]MBY3250203.1 hypothetical protein [Rhizobium laguerreae]